MRARLFGPYLSVISVIGIPTTASRCRRQKLRAATVQKRQQPGIQMPNPPARDRANGTDGAIRKKEAFLDVRRLPDVQTTGSANGFRVHKEKGNEHGSG
jgi:hypothetical protein